MKYKRQSNTRSDHIATEAYKTDVSDIKIETEARAEGGKFQNHLILLYGAPKIGKSTLFSHFPGVYFLPTEPGYKSLKVRKTRIPNWATFRKFIQTIEKKPKSIADVSLFCIDTATNLSKFCMQWTCGREGIAHPSDEEWGKGWEAFADEFAYWVLRLADIGKGIGFIAHQSTMEVISRSMKVTKETPDIPKTTYRIVNNMCDIILQMSYVKKGKNPSEFGALRCLYTKPTETRDAGDRTGKLPDVIRFKTEKQAVRKILACFE